MATIFTKIIKGEIPAYKIVENESFLAFLDINPLQKGHTLVIPKVEIDEFFRLEDSTLSKMIIFSKKVSVAIKKAYPCNRIGMSVIGLEVPHAHIHLIPINKMSDLNFANQKLKLTPINFEEIAQKIKENFNY